MTPDQYYDLSFFELFEIVDGAKDRIIRNEKQARKAVYISLLPFANNLSFHWFCENYWPLPGDNENVVDDTYDPVMEQDLFDQMLKKHNLTIQHAGRRTKSNPGI